MDYQQPKTRIFPSIRFNNSFTINNENTAPLESNPNKNSARNTRRRAFGNDISNVPTGYNLPTFMKAHQKPLSGRSNSQKAHKTLLNNSWRGPEVDKSITSTSEQRLKDFYGSVVVDQEKTLLHVDKAEIQNPQLCGHYAQSILEHLRSIENLHLPKYGYIKAQTDITEKMRAILIDWLVEVHLKFKLLPETLFLTVNIIDRYLEEAVLPRQKLQLVGVTAMLLACKYEEIYAPEIKDFVYITDKAYSKEQIIAMEQSILAKLEFNITVPSSFRFLERYMQLAGWDNLTFMLSRYLIELPLTECQMLKYSPSQTAAAALYLAQKILKKESPWSDFIVQTTRYTEACIKPCMKDLFNLVQGIEKGSLQAIKKKFSHLNYSEVAKIKIES